MYPYNIKNNSAKNISAQETTPNTPHTYTSESSLPMIKDCMQLASNNSEFYKDFSQQFQDIPTKELVLKMYLNKCKASKMLSEIYYQLTSEKLTTPSPATPSLSDDISENAETQMLSELNDISIFQTLLFSLLNVGLRDMLYEIITDMQSNAQILNYLYCKYK